MEEVDKIAEELREGALNNDPQGCAQRRARLAGWYAFFSGQQEDIIMRKSALWNELRKGVQSDTACERLYGATEDGINESGLKSRLKTIGILMTALNGLQRLHEGQAKGQF